MEIPLVDLKAQYQSIKEEIDAAVARVFQSGQFILGREVEGFEEEFARYCDVRYAVAVNSGTSALFLALSALGVGAGDEVITVSQTFVATVEAICWTGAKPVFVDIDEVTYTMDPTQVESALTPRTKVILPVHLYGHPADMDPILEIARRRNLKVLEDACQAHGALYKGKKAGSLGDAACFSFYPGKNLGAYGEGGAVVTNEEGLATLMRKLRNHGGLKKYSHDLVGTNARMEALQGAILGTKLPHLDRWNLSRRQHAGEYSSLLEKDDELVLPREASYAKSAFHLYVIRTPRRDELDIHLNKKGIRSLVHYPVPNHLLSCFGPLGYRPGSLPVTERIAKEVLSLPLFPELSPEQIRYVVGHVHEFLQGVRSVEKNSPVRRLR